MQDDSTVNGTLLLFASFFSSVTVWLGSASAYESSFTDGRGFTPDSACCRNPSPVRTRLCSRLHPQMLPNYSTGTPMNNRGRGTLNGGSNICFYICMCLVFRARCIMYLPMLCNVLGIVSRVRELLLCTYSFVLCCKDAQDLRRTLVETNTLSPVSGATTAYTMQPRARAGT